MAIQLQRWEVQAIVTFLTGESEFCRKNEYKPLLTKLKYSIAKTADDEVSETLEQSEKHQLYIVLGEMQYSLGKCRKKFTANSS